MCTGSRPVVRSPTAAAAAAGSMLSVRGSMSQKTGFAFSYRRQLAEATNGNGAAPAPAPPPGPRGRASPAGSRRRGGGARSLVLRAAGQHARLQRVHERLPARLDDVLGHSDRAPGVGPVAGVEQHARDGAGALALVQDADLEVHELDVAQVGVALADRLTQRLVERVDGAVALGGADIALAVHPDLDRRLGLDPAVGALLHDGAPRLEPEQRLVLARLLADQEVERAVGRLELVARVLELLDPLHHPGGS